MVSLETWAFLPNPICRSFVQGLLALDGVTGYVTAEAVLVHPHLKSLGSAVVTGGNPKKP